MTGAPAKLPLLVVLGLAALVRVAAILTVGDTRTLRGDEEYYVEHARSLAAGAGYEGSMRPPLYPAFLAVAFKLSGGSLLAARLLQIPVSLLTALLVFDLVARLFGRRAALVSCGATALLPTLVHYTHFLWSETLFVALFMASLWALVRFDLSRHPRWLVAAGLAFGLAALTRELILPYALFMAAWIILRSDKPGERVVRGMAFLVPAALVIAPWTVRNFALDGRLVPVATLRWYAVAVGNLADRGTVGEQGAGATGRVFTRRYFSDPDELRREAFAREVALREIREQQPWWLFAKLRHNLPKLFGTEGQLRRFEREGWLPDAYQALGARLASLEFAAYVVFMLIATPAIWLVAGRGEKPLFAGAILFLVALHVVANAVARFRVPLLPLFAVYTGPWLMGSSVRARWWNFRLVAAAASVLLFLASLWSARSEGQP